MKILIKESQYRLLVEQSMTGWSQGLTPKQANDTVKGWNKGLTSHGVMTILQITTAFIPIVGPFISSGIGFLDAKKYYDEGDKKTATLVAIFSSLPAIGSVVSKIPGIAELGKKGMSSLAVKITKSLPLTPNEIKIVNGISSESKLIQTEAQKIFQNTGKGLSSVSGGFKTIIPQEIKAIIQKTPSIKVNDKILNIIKNNVYDLKSSDGIISRLGRDIGNTTKMDYNSVDLALKNLTKLENIGKGQTLNIKSTIDNAYKSVYEIEDLIRKFPKDRDLLWSAKSGILRFVDDLTTVLK